ncbi:hypothetical protein [Microbacterium sp.]|uniref:hypothetical protein n=1 Tax=Microbacterium sp. TaxID=51671 RepID=UPI002811FF98|nr:hypothetical protein [Microbacterium sp.]
MSDPKIEGPTPEVERPESPPVVPGATAGYGTLPKDPVDIEPALSGPDADGEAFAAAWEPHEEPEAVDDARLAPWALFAAIVALATSLFVGWGIPVAIVSVIAAIMSLRRPVESRAMARWALVLGIVATVYSSGWLIWAGMQFESGG